MENKSKVKVCCFCGKIIEGWGNNPDGAMWKDENGNIVEYEYKDGDTCCDECNGRYVIVGRIYKLYHNKGDKK